ncbi:MAG: glycosyltransferase family 39 protein, partial [Candidatus Omnitrophota bacterium]
VLRIFKLSFFEFKNDQLYLIQNGVDTRKANFLVTKGIASGVGINNPPLFSYFMGILTFFAQDPFWLSSFFSFISTLGLLLAFFYFYRNLPLDYCLISCSILSFSSAFTNYTANIWPQCLLPPLVIIYHWSLCRFIENKSSKLFLLFTISAALISQLHMSGFFLMPAVLIVALIYRAYLGIGNLLKSAFALLLILSPYLYHIFFENELAKFISFADTGGRSVYWKVFREHMRMASFDYWRYYFRYDFNSVLDSSVGIFKFILYPLSCLIMAFFAFGLIYYLAWLVKGHKIFDESAKSKEKYPLPFQIAGFLLLVPTFCFLLFHIHTPMHYLIIFFPCYSILSGFLCWRLWKILWLRVIITCSVLATLVLLAALLIFIKNAGGHPHEYGPHYGQLLAWQKEVWSQVPKGFCPALTFKFNFEKGFDKFDQETINYVIMKGHSCMKNSPEIPLLLDVFWDKKLMRYTYSVRKI